MRKAATQARYLFWCSLLSVTASAQTKPSAAIPATAPTQTTTSVSDLPSARPQAPAASQGTGHVTWDGALLRIEGNGASLRDVLRTVAQKTGMKISGGMPDERVFESYGPAPVQQVLADLFRGVAVNMMLINGTATKPKELILTARSGAPSLPPAQPASMEQTQSGMENAPAGNGGGFAAQPGPRQQLPGNTDQPPPGGATVPDAGGNGASGSDAAGAQPNGGTRTPEQIFEELRRRQQQQNH